VPGQHNGVDNPGMAAALMAAGGPACPRCGGPSRPWTLARDRAGGPPAEVRRCRSRRCGIGFTWPPPLPAPAALAAMPGGALAAALARRLLAAELRPLLARRPPPADLIDLGAGAGARAAAAAAAGYRVVAIEPDPAEAARASAGLDGAARVVAGELAAAAADGLGPVDAVLAWHVLEHVPDIDRTLAEILSILRPGGVLVAAVPNPGGAEARAFGGRWHGWEPARHRWHLTRGTLARAVAAAGFEAIEARAQGGWRYPASLAFSIAPGLDPQVRPERARAGRALAAAMVPAAALTRGLGIGPQLVVSARTPARAFRGRSCLD
jgi:SAM-dependent methyltransferase